MRPRPASPASEPSISSPKNCETRYWPDNVHRGIYSRGAAGSAVRLGGPQCVQAVLMACQEVLGAGVLGRIKWKVLP